MAEAISVQLAARNYEMPGEERTSNAAGLHEIRYFFLPDRWKAEGLAGDLNQILTDSGYQADIEVEDLTDYKGAKPRPGTIELWLEPVRVR